MRKWLILRFLLKSMSQSSCFFIVAIALFNLLTDFTIKLGIIQATLTAESMQGFGVISVMLAINNAISKKFFGFGMNV